MRGLLRGMTLVAAFAAFGLTVGCAGNAPDEVLEYDEEASKKAADEYAQQMRDAMKNQGGGGRR